MEKMSVNQLVKELSNTANNMAFNPYNAGVEMGDEISRQHRTIQGVIINLLISILTRLGDTEYTDARNSVGIESCRKIKQLVEDGEIKFQPFI